MLPLIEDVPFALLQALNLFRRDGGVLRGNPIKCPAAGDAITTLLSGYIVYEAYRAGLPKSALLRMIANILIDFVISAVPLLGDIGDIFWRANRRNLAIFDDYLARRRGGAIIEGTWRPLDRR